MIPADFVRLLNAGVAVPDSAVLLSDPENVRAAGGAHVDLVNQIDGQNRASVQQSREERQSMMMVVIM